MLLGDKDHLHTTSLAFLIKLYSYGERGTYNVLYEA